MAHPGGVGRRLILPAKTEIFWPVTHCEGILPDLISELLFVARAAVTVQAARDTSAQWLRKVVQRRTPAEEPFNRRRRIKGEEGEGHDA